MRDLLIALFDGRLEGRHGLIPEPVEVLAQGVDPVRVELVDAAVAGRPVDHEARVLEHLEVLRDRGPADRQLTRELADGRRTVRQPLEDRLSCGVAKCRQASLVSGH
jgi:hypothetical protein